MDIYDKTRKIKRLTTRLSHDNRETGDTAEHFFIGFASMDQKKNKIIIEEMITSKENERLGVKRSTQALHIPQSLSIAAMRVGMKTERIIVLLHSHPRSEEKGVMYSIADLEFQLYWWKMYQEYNTALFPAAFVVVDHATYQCIIWTSNGPQRASLHVTGLTESGEDLHINLLNEWMEKERLYESV